MKKLFPSTLIQSIGLILISLVLTSPLIFLAKNRSFNIPSEAWEVLFYIVLCCVVIVIAYFINRRRKIEVSFNFRIEYITYIPLMVLSLITLDLGFVVPLAQILTAKFSSNTILINPIESIIPTLGALFIAPIFEEMIFRGIILKGLLNSYSPKWAIFVSAILFAVAHGQPIQIFSALILGIFLSWLYYKTKSLGIVIILHFVANLSSTAASYVSYKYGSITNAPIPPIYGNYTLYIILISLSLFAISFYYLYQKQDETDTITSANLDKQG